jgi:hypothetical protein
MVPAALAVVVTAIAIKASAVRRDRRWGDQPLDQRRAPAEGDGE